MFNNNMSFTEAKPDDNVDDVVNVRLSRHRCRKTSITLDPFTFSL